MPSRLRCVCVDACEEALIIGDVHQLEPVFTLSGEDERRVQAATRISLEEDKLSSFRVFESWEFSSADR